MFGDHGVVAGQSGAALSDLISLGVPAASVPRDVVDAAVAARGRSARRAGGKLPPHVMVYFAMALALYADDDYEEVMVTLSETLASWGCWDQDWTVPTTGGITQARVRLGFEPMAEVFEAVAVPVADELTSGAWLGRWRLMAIDGFEWDVPDSAEDIAGFGYSGSGDSRSAFPKARVVTISECASHAVVAAGIGGMHNGEQTLARQLYPGLEPDRLLIADRNLCATRRSVAFPAQPGGIGGVFLDPMAYPDSKEGRGREHASKPVVVSRRMERCAGGSA